MPTLKQLLETRETLPTLPGNPAPLTNAPYNKPFGKNPIGEIVKTLVGKEGLQREEADLVQVGNFVKRIPQIYGTDSVRILTQSDPHAKKAAIKKVAGAVGSIFGTSGLGGLINKGISKVADFNPKFPDDFLEGDDTNPTFNLYANLYNSDYAGGKYYNGGVKNEKTELGKFLNGIKTPSQLKDQALGKLKSLGIGLARKGLTKLFSKKANPNKLKTKQHNTFGKYSSLQLDSYNEGRLSYKKTSPIFPSLNIWYTTKNLSDGLNYVASDMDTVAINQFASGNGTISSTIPVGTSYIISQKRDETPNNFEAKFAYNLNSLYYAHWDRTTLKNNDTDTSYLASERSYYSTLYEHDELDFYKRIGQYSKDILRVFDINSKPMVWKEYPSITAFEQEGKPQWENLIPTGSSLVYGTTNTNISPNANTNMDVNHMITYNHSSGLPNIVRYNTILTPFSRNTTEILKYDYSFAKETAQSQYNDQNTLIINPYINQKKDILQSTADKYDRIKFKIGDNILLATLTGIADNTTPSWTDVKSVGSGFKFYLYDSWEREISFKFQMYAETEAELGWIWEKANKIKELTLPNNAGSNGVFGRVVPLVIGDLIDAKHGFLTACNTTIIDESPWQITEGLQKPFIYEMDITYKVISNDANYTHYKAQATGSALTLDAGVYKKIFQKEDPNKKNPNTTKAQEPMIKINDFLPKGDVNMTYKKYNNIQPNNPFTTTQNNIATELIPDNTPQPAVVEQIKKPYNPYEWTKGFKYGGQDYSKP